MNNQRKFRVWDKMRLQFIYPENDNQQHFIIDLNGRFYNLQNGSGDNDYVVQEYTGLTDKYDNPIYEGDLVKWDNLNYLVEWNDIAYKCRWYGRNYIEIDRWFPSSKRCSNCGYIAQESELEAKRFVELYFECFSENTDCTFESLFIKVEGEKGSRELFNRSRFIAYYFQSSTDFFPRFENLYSLIQSFYRLIGIDEINNPYIHHFVDLLYHFDLNIGSDISGFLKEYDSKSKSSSIQIPDNKDAIKIMTGHKSKGLEFPIVILPNMNFSLESKRTKLLVEQNNHFFYVPISKNSKIKNIRKESNSELSNIFLDKLNLCYVMTTRPVERLYIGNFYVEEKNFGGFFDESLRIIASELAFKIDNNRFIFGEKQILSKMDLKSFNNQFVPLKLNDRLWFPKISLIKEMTNEEFELSEPQRYGNQLHFLLSAINSVQDIDGIIDKFSKEDLIEKEFENRLKKDLKAVFANKSYINISSGSISVSSERKIIASNFEIKIPDKIFYKKDEIIVIDFKTGLPSKHHYQQVSDYMDLLFQMESKPVKGYLFYISNLELIQVERT